MQSKGLEGWSPGYNLLSWILAPSPTRCTRQDRGYMELRGPEWQKSSALVLGLMARLSSQFLLVIVFALPPAR